MFIIVALVIKLNQDENNGVPKDDMMILCIDDGLQWLPQGALGAFFMFMHNMIMFSSSVQVVKAFFLTPKKTVYFKSEVPLTDDVVNSMHELEK